MTFLAKILGAHWLGHGRALEFFLFCVTASYGLTLFVYSDISFTSLATNDIAWKGYGRYLAFPLLIQTSLSGYGLIANIQRLPYSRYCRLVGALFGLFIWCWLAAKFWIIGEPSTLGAFWSLWAFIFHIRIFGMAWANLPKPGAPAVL